MKKILCLQLVFIFIFVFCACSAQMTAVENYLIAVKNMDMEGISGSLGGEDRNLEILDRNLNEEEEEALRKLYALMQYSMGEQTEENGARFVDVTLQIPDVQRIFELVDKQILVSAESAEKLVLDMIESGAVEKTMMIEKKISVKMIESDGKWLIDSGDANKDFFDAVGLELVMGSFVLD